NARTPTDVIELPLHPGARHADDRTVEVDVLPARQLRVKSSPDLEQRADCAGDADLAARRHRDRRDDLEQRALAGAVGTDDAEHLAFMQLERNLLERCEPFAPTLPRRRSIHYPPPPIGHRVAQRVMPAAADGRADIVFADAACLDEPGHQITSTRSASMRRKNLRPPRRSAAVKATKRTSPPALGGFPPMIAHRAVSTMTAIGLSS